MTIYRRCVRAFLARHTYCSVFPNLYATQVHHKRGRLKALLLDERFWLPVSAEGHLWLHDHPAEARKRGLLGPVGSWNNYPAAVKAMKANRGKFQATDKQTTDSKVM